jgi:hypothetical protein
LSIYVPYPGLKAFGSQLISELDGSEDFIEFRVTELILDVKVISETALDQSWCL